MVSFVAHPFGEGMKKEEHQENRERTSRKKKEKDNSRAAYDMYPPPHTRKKEEKDQLKRQSALSFLIKSLSHTHKHTHSLYSPRCGHVWRGNSRVGTLLFGFRFRFSFEFRFRFR